MRTEVVVTGAGPTGLSLACGLAAAGVAVRVVDAAGSPATTSRAAFGIQRRLAASYRRGRVLLAGDAAHIHSPFGGQGMNTGIGDAENLAWKLALVVAGRAGTGLLDTYAAERRPIAREVLASTSSITVAALGHARVARLLRDRVAIPLLNQAWLQRLIMDKASQLQVSYRRGPLGARRRLPTSLHPGDRVPNRECVSADGAAMRLHDALGPQWALLGAEPLAEVARTRLGDVTGLSGGRDGTALLVRPDGHLAWRGTDPHALHTWLDAMLGPHTEVLTR